MLGALHFSTIEATTVLEALHSIDTQHGSAQSGMEFVENRFAKTLTGVHQ